MQSLGWLRQGVVDWIGDSSESQLIDRAINRSVAKIATRCTFSQLMNKVTVTPDSDGIVLVPPRCDKILEVYPSSALSNAADFVFGGERRVQDHIRRIGYKYRGVGVLKEPLADVLLDFTNKNSSAEQSSGSTDDLSVDHIGHELVILGGSEKYLITDIDTSGVANTVTLYPEYRFATAPSLQCHIRRVGIEQIALYNETGTAYTGEITIEFREVHPYLVASSDMLLIPTPETVYLDAVRFMLMETKYTVDAERLESEYQEAKAFESSKQVSSRDSTSWNRDTVFKVHNRARGTRSRRW
jgi:hypothetical protein